MGCMDGATLSLLETVGYCSGIISIRSAEDGNKASSPCGAILNCFNIVDCCVGILNFTLPEEDICGLGINGTFPFCLPRCFPETLAEPRIRLVPGYLIKEEHS